MDDPAIQETRAAAAPCRSQLAGTRLIHYGPLWDDDLERARQQNQAPVAILVCHGMGQQVRYETISSVAQALRREAANEGAAVHDVEVNLSKLDDTFLARAEINWTEPHAPGAPARERSVHVYEAYWAPLTEGRVTYWDTIKFLSSAACNGIRYSHPFSSRTFQRWLFGGPKTMRIGRATFFALCCVLAFLLAQVAVIGFVLLELTQQYKAVIAQPLPVVDLHHFWPGLVQLAHDWLRWAGPLFPEHPSLIHARLFSHDWWWGLGKLLGWFALIAEALFVRYFIIEYVGDVAAYISPYKDSKFDELRHQIQKVGLDVGKIIYGFGLPNQRTGSPGQVNSANPPVSSHHDTAPNDVTPRYEKILVVGHSLGSVLAYDTLNALINLDNVSQPPDKRRVVARTRGLVTFGSPLDKTAFIFRMQARNEQDWIREQLAASVQPLIVDYDLYRPPPFEWFNIWSPMDIISGELNYYDNPNLFKKPGVSPNVPPFVQNAIDPKARVPLYAHVQYWNNPLLREQLYRLVTS